MTVTAFVIVLFAAFLHALWNAIVKGAHDRTLVLGLVALGHVIPGLAVAASFPLPSMASVPFIVASTLIHWGYYYLLNVAYRTGDLSVVYPIARGSAPILIALGAWFWVGEALPLMAWLGIVAVSFGILLLARGAFSTTLGKNGVVAAVGVAVMIASYSIVDGVGVRLSGSPMGYIGWLFVAEIFVVIFVFATRWPRFQTMPPRAKMLGFAGGIISALAYGLVLLVKTEAPLGIVSALRETSVIFAALIGVYWFGEGPKRKRFIAACIVGAGIIALALTKP